MNSIQVDVFVIGAGVIGSWVALHSISKGYTTAICDWFDSDGISTRNSGVLHAGLYYDANSLKSKHCVTGKRLTEQFIDTYSLPILRCGKIVTNGKSASPESVDKLFEIAKSNGAEQISLIDLPNENYQNIYGSRAILSKSTTVIDTSAYLKCLHRLIEEKGGLFLQGSRFIDGQPSHFLIENQNRQTETIQSKFLINAAGLFSDSIANRAGLTEYKIQPVRGEYYRLKKNHTIKTLVYGLPAAFIDKTDTALGIHYTIQPGGETYLGPNSKIATNKSDYNITASAQEFAESAGELIEGINEFDLVPGYSGLRPRLFRNQKPVTDFVIQESQPGFYHFLGIESPGLTCAPSLVTELPF